MKTSRLARTLAAVVVAVGMIGVTSTAQAAYPPSRVGYFPAVFPMKCTYDKESRLVSASKLGFTYVVEVPSADFMVTRADGEVVHIETAEMGVHTYEYTPTGLEVFQSFSAELTGQTDSGWDVASATIAGCPVPDPLDAFGDGGSPSSGAKAVTPATTNSKPVTGSASWLVGALAVALLIGGATMVVVARRRPAST